MIGIIKKLGSYIVIEEGIAIPHGSISENVLKDGIFILISKKEVFLPNEKPVNIFIAFAIKERENQQKILKFIFNLASNENTKDIIDYLEEIQC